MSRLIWRSMLFGIVAGLVMVGTALLFEAFGQKPPLQVQSQMRAFPALCMPVTSLKEALERHKEKIVATGVVDSQRLLRVYASKKGTFTIAVVSITGVACMIVIGQDFETVTFEDDEGDKI